MDDYVKKLKMRNWKSITKFEKSVCLGLLVSELLLLLVNVKFGFWFSWFSFGFSFGAYCFYVLVTFGWIPFGSPAAPALSDQEVNE